jgi:hypothetical protein
MATAFLQVSDRAASTLASGITNVATTLDVAAGEGALFPSTFPFYITIGVERISVAARSSDTLSSLTRGVDGTTGTAASTGDTVQLNIISKHISDLNTAVNTLEDAGSYTDGAAILAVEGEATLALASGATIGGSPAVVDSDIGSTVQAYDATIVVDADIGSTVQAQSAVLDTFAAGTDVTVEQGGTGASTLTGHLKGNGTSAITASVDVELADAQNVSINTPLLAGANATTTGMTAEMLAGGTIGAMDAVCIHSVTQEVVIADASAVATARAIGFAPAAISDTATGTILLQGTVRDDTWTWTPGGAIYLSETGGSVTQTAPTTSGAFVQVVGVALSPVLMYFNPDMSIIELA